MKFRYLYQLSIMLFPWRIRAYLLNRLNGFKIHPAAYIGYSLLGARNIVLERGARIGHLTLVKDIDRINLEEYARLGSLNYVTGCPSSNRQFFQGQARSPSLTLRRHAAITSRHFLDCTDSIEIGSFSTIAGIRSTFFTHSLNVYMSKQTCCSIEIGKYCFIGSSSLILPGARVDDYVVVGAGAVLPKGDYDTLTLYAGNPIQKIKTLEKDEILYFTRPKGFVE